MRLPAQSQIILQFTLDDFSKIMQSALVKTKTQSLAELYCSDPLKACRLALRRTRNLEQWTPKGKGSENRIDAINALLGLHGTEAIRGEWQNGFWCDIVAVYANTGDTYALTVIQVRDDSGWHFIISSVGDFVERNQKRLGLL